MPTLFEARIIIVARVDRAAAVASWINTNIGADTVPANLGPGLSPTGQEPATHRWSNGAYQPAAARAILFRCCDLAGVAKPTLATWNGWTWPQRITWLRSVQIALWQQWELGVDLARNDGEWDDPPASLARVGLQPIVGSLP